MQQDLRGALDAYAAAGALVHINDEVDWNYEAAGVYWRLGRGPAAVLHNVTGYRVPLVGNVLNSRDKLAIAMGIPTQQLQERVAGALHDRIRPVVVADPPCQQVRLDAPFKLLDRFPVPAISEHDGGRYISAGLITARHPVTGRRNLAICRLQVREDDTMGVYMAPTHSSQFLQSHRELGRPMEVAIAVGSHPAMMAASQMLVPYDEVEIAGGLFGEPARLAQCLTVDLQVPAGSEIVIEGTVDPGEAEPEGPFGEFPGAYAPVRDNPVVRVSAVTTRRNPMFQMIVGGTHPEHLITGAVSREATLFDAIRAVVPGVRQVVLTEGGTCRFHAVVSIAQRVAGEARLAMLTAFAAQDLIKHVTVVDDDIDALDPRQVEWAVATRMRAHQDLLVIPGMKSNPVDPMSIDRTITKLGIDATLPVGADPRARVLPAVPEEVRRRLDARWDGLISGSPAR